MNISLIQRELALVDSVVPLEGKHYANCLHAYESASNQRALIHRWFKDRLGLWFSAEPVSVLSVGCGAGDLDIELLTALEKHAPKVTYVGVEPDGEQCDRFRTRLGARNREGTQIEAYNSRFEAFAEPRRFDLVVLVHSLYYMDDPQQALQHALNLLSESGRLVVLIASDDTLNELASAFWARENGGSTWFSEDLSAHLETLGIEFECDRIAAKLDITSCSEPFSTQGEQIADFVAQVPTGRLPGRLRQMIFDYLETIAQHDAGLRWLPHNVDAFTIQPGQKTLPGQPRR